MWTKSKVDQMANDKNERSQRKDNLRREKSDWNGLRILNEEYSMHCNEGGRESFHAFLVWVSVGQGALCQHQSRFCCLLFKRKAHQSRYITILMSDSSFFFFHDTSNFTMF